MNGSVGQYDSGRQHAEHLRVIQAAIVHIHMCHLNNYWHARTYGLFLFE